MARRTKTRTDDNSRSSITIISIVEILNNKVSQNRDYYIAKIKIGKEVQPMIRTELIDKIEKISARLEELKVKEQNEGLTLDEIQDAIILGEWLDELALEEVTED